MKIERGLIVSCQALKNEPLYGGNTIPKMAMAAKMGGAVGIRANTVKDINAIYKYLQGSLPIIGLIKRVYADSPVYITPTIREARELIGSHCDVIALDATARTRHCGVTLKEVVNYIRANSDKPIMADIATLDEAIAADELGFDYVSSTMRSYTEQTQGIHIPDIEFLRQLKQNIKHAQIIAEGGIHTYEELDEVLNVGIDHIVIGGAITRPQNITRDYVSVFAKNEIFSRG
jgi:N-acylglucosamine-6-phosphate 2-epimerase